MARCKETAGFLFSHPCRRGDVARCGLCEKPICEKHVRVHDGKRVCVSCHKEHNKATPGSQKEAWRRDDPYYYSSFYYHDYDDYSSYDSYSMDDRDAFDSGAAGWSEDWGDDWENDYDGS